MNINTHTLPDSLQAGFIDKTLPSYKEYLPQLLVNDKSEGKKVLTTIIQELNNCEEFWFSVAFITKSGIASLIETILNLGKRGIKGKILVSQYLNFTQPEALKTLLKLKNIEVKIAVDNSFHSKGYLFKKREVYNLIIGSSNLTASALATNIEWNLKITATPISHIIFNAIKEFTTEYHKAVFVDMAFINNYEILYNKQLDYSKLLKKELVVLNQLDIIPNSMQVEALNNIEQLRVNGKIKALLISATGTGKTFLSAFDVKKVNPKKFLFVVHRLNIARAALLAYKTIFGEDKSMGIYSGNQKELEADFIFSTIQTISKGDNLKQFDPRHFEYMVIDETHRAGADSYQEILNYFKPTFLLGMTATPERTDGLDVFKLFDYNIAFEIRLHRALAENMLSPFHYYGVTDIIVDGKILEENSDFNLLASKERIERILEKADIYGCDNGKVRGLIFCSSIVESKALSDEFNLRGLKTIALSGADNDEQRSKAISMLEKNDLQYIFTVDIFNEGIDIPSVNQIIMLRPTQSAIVFVQQLGRGLRKIDDKDYLTVIDFIGNYKNNFLVPIALYGDTTYNKDSLRKLMSSGSSLIPGTSTINFDEISRAKIFEAIDAANMQLKRDLVKDYNLLKYRLGRMPMMIDFLKQGSRDPQLFIKYSKSYFNFVMELENELKDILDGSQKKLLEIFANEINNSKRVEESIILKHLLNSNSFEIDMFVAQIKNEYGYLISNETIESCINNLNFKFITENKNGKLVTVHDIYRFKVLTKIDNQFVIDETFSKYLENPIFLKFLLDNVEYAIQTYNNLFFKTKFIDGFVLYRKYSRKDVFRILNWVSNPLAQNVGGYMISGKKDNCPIFVNYHKEESISNSTKYEDGFLNNAVFEWMSKSNRKLISPDVAAIIDAKNSLRLPLFIKKNNDEGTEFYFMGDMTPVKDSAVQTSIPDDAGNQVSVVKIDFKMDHPVEDAIYEYITTPIVTAFNYVESKVVDTSEKVLIEEASTENVSIDVSLNPFRILSENEIKQYENCIPLYNIKVAAGDFSEPQNNIEPQWIELKRPFKYNQDLFVCQVVGESMNKIIPPNSWCLFKKYPGGTRSGKIVLAHAVNIQDQDFGKGFTVKLYESEKVITDENWSHTSILLKPQSYNIDYQNIILKEEDLIDFKIVGIFMEVLY